MTKLTWTGTVTSVQPRIRAKRPPNERSHTTHGYIIGLVGTIEGQPRDFRVVISQAAQTKLQIRIGDVIAGSGESPLGPDVEYFDVYKVTKLKVTSPAPAERDRTPPCLNPKPTIDINPTGSQDGTAPFDASPLPTDSQSTSSDVTPLPSASPAKTELIKPCQPPTTPGSPGRGGEIERLAKAIDSSVFRLLAVVVTSFAAGIGASPFLISPANGAADSEAARLRSDLSAREQTIAALEGATQEARDSGDALTLFRWSAKWEAQGSQSPHSDVTQLKIPAPSSEPDKVMIERYQSRQIWTLSPAHGWEFAGVRSSFEATATLTNTPEEELARILPQTNKFFASHKSLVWRLAKPALAERQPTQFIQVTILTADEIRELLTAGVADTVGPGVFGQIAAMTLPKKVSDFFMRDPGVALMLGSINENLVKPALAADAVPTITSKKSESTMVCVGWYPVDDGQGSRPDAVSHIALRRLGNDFLIVHTHSLGPHPWVIEWLARFRVR